MIFNGSIYHKTEHVLGGIEVTQGPTQLKVEIKVEGDIVLEFPLPNGCDINEITRRSTIILNQTGILNPPARIELVEST